MPGPIRNQAPSLQAFLQQNVGKTLEIANVSANPEAAASAEGDVMEVGANSWQSFSDQLPEVQEGDVLKVRARTEAGNASQWILLQASGLQQQDTRNAQIYSDALAMELNEAGGVDIVYLGDGMVSEPGAQIRIKNEISGEAFDATLDANGQLPPDFAPKGEKGDIFSVAISDGVNNVDFSETVGLMELEGPPRIDLPEPAMWAKKHVDDAGKPKFGTVQFKGPLFVEEPSIGDVKQGSLANCYFAAAVGSVAHTDPAKLKKMFKDNGDGTYTVTFKQPDIYGRWTHKKVKIDGDLYVQYGEKPLYGNSNGKERGADEMELWFPLLEKAYAALHGNSYDEIGNGGNPAAVMTSILGSRSYHKSIDPERADRIFDSLQNAQERGWPATATTFGKDSEEAERYPGSGIFPWHVYSVMGVEQKDGQKYVQMRNPWGNTEPGYDGKNDGIFLLELEKFAHLFKEIHVAQG